MHKLALITKVVDGPPTPNKLHNFESSIISASDLVRNSSVLNHGDMPMKSNKLSQNQIEVYMKNFNMKVNEIFETSADYHSMSFGEDYLSL